MALFETGAHEIAILMVNNLKQTIKLDLVGFPWNPLKLISCDDPTNVYHCLSAYYPYSTIYDCDDLILPLLSLLMNI